MILFVVCVNLIPVNYFSRQRVALFNRRLTHSQVCLVFSRPLSHE